MQFSRCKSAANERWKLVGIAGNWWEFHRLKSSAYAKTGFISGLHIIASKKAKFALALAWERARSINAREPDGIFVFTPAARPT
jgi:hypothetical protein